MTTRIEKQAGHAAIAGVTRAAMWWRSVDGFAYDASNDFCFSFDGDASMHVSISRIRPKQALTAVEWQGNRI
jgi:hypothetical protein